VDLENVEGQGPKRRLQPTLTELCDPPVTRCSLPVGSRALPSSAAGTVLRVASWHKLCRSLSEAEASVLQCSASKRGLSASWTTKAGWAASSDSPHCLREHLLHSVFLRKHLRKGAVNLQDSASLKCSAPAVSEVSPPAGHCMSSTAQYLDASHGVPTPWSRNMRRQVPGSTVTEGVLRLRSESNILCSAPTQLAHARAVCLTSTMGSVLSGRKSVWRLHVACYGSNMKHGADSQISSETHDPQTTRDFKQ